MGGLGLKRGEKGRKVGGGTWAEGGGGVRDWVCIDPSTFYTFIT